ncbi:mitochondrial uncoupling protein 4-like isoform X2 [Xenia sp. Carnegie-2017]|uniref:mitochondrial uncoupling protein 4-like isoform X2 n=1 Tax=Xenia sp. Carnegie-2017 TaxID=2897299 RepID=UPI001F0368BB|nr:mitochondrial uncoupling protein 4-like isoform X2 [Xenia sp. Carnegie-2017]
MVTFPLDITKTRLQIQGEKTSMVTNGKQQPYRGMVKTAYGIVKEEGFLSLWRGIRPAVLRHLVYSGSRMAAYEMIREKVLLRNDNGSFPLWKSIIGGISSGAIGQFLASPTDLVKVQMQMEGRRILEGKPPRYRGTAHAFSSIVKQNGVRGLWRGWLPNVQRAALVNLGDLTTYDSVKQILISNTDLEDTAITHMLSSISAGLVAATMGTPADVIKTRIMNNPSTYKGVIDCFMTAVKEEGFFALYKGFIPTWSRMAPWSMTFWLVHEQIRKLTGISGF